VLVDRLVMLARIATPAFDDGGLPWFLLLGLCHEGTPRRSGANDVPDDGGAELA
jgi:hypothetical protein